MYKLLHEVKTRVHKSLYKYKFVRCHWCHFPNNINIIESVLLRMYIFDAITSVYIFVYYIVLYSV